MSLFIEAREMKLCNISLTKPRACTITYPVIWNQHRRQILRLCYLWRSMCCAG